MADSDRAQNNELQNNSHESQPKFNAAPKESHSTDIPARVSKLSDCINELHHRNGSLKIMFADQQDQVENEFRNIKLKLRGPNRHSELQAVKALMAMSAQQNLYRPESVVAGNKTNATNNDDGSNKPTNQTYNSTTITTTVSTITNGTKRDPSNNQRSRSESPEPIYGLSITMTEEDFRILAEKEGIKDVIGEPICKLCGGLFSGPLGIALHMCPAMKRQTFRCEICGEDKWKTKANLHSHIKWCKKRLSMKTEQHESKNIY